MSWACRGSPTKFLGGVVHSADCVRRAVLFRASQQLQADRLPQVTSSGASMVAERRQLRAGNNRTHMIRVPDPGRFELRLMDGAANPVPVAGRGCSAAGLDGIAHERDPGKRLDINMYTDGHKVKRLRKLPANMLDAVRSVRQEQG